MKIYSDGDIRVAVAGQHWTFNPAVLVKESSVGTPANEQSAQGRETTARSELQGILQPSPSSTSSSKSQRQHQRHSSAEERRNVPQSQREIGKNPKIKINNRNLASRRKVNVINFYHIYNRAAASL